MLTISSQPEYFLEISCAQSAHLIQRFVISLYPYRDTPGSLGHSWQTHFFTVHVKPHLTINLHNPIFLSVLPFTLNNVANTTLSLHSYPSVQKAKGAV